METYCAESENEKYLSWPAGGAHEEHFLTFWAGNGLRKAKRNVIGQNEYEGISYWSTPSTR